MFSVCSCERVNVCTKLDLGREEDMLCVCVYMFKEALPPTPQVNVGFFARNYYRLFFFKIVNVYSYFLVFCGLPFPFFYFTFQL